MAIESIGQPVLEGTDDTWVHNSSARALWNLKFHRLARSFRDPAVAIPAAVLFLIIFLCFAGPAIGGLPDPDASVLRAGSVLAPLGTSGHLIGTDQLGRDNLSRLLHGGQVSIVVGIGATFIGLSIGTLLGMVAGFFGGIIGATIMRLLDALLAFPGLILALAIAEFLGPSEWHSILAISVFSISTFGRLARGHTLSVRHRDFIVAARTNGSSSRKIIFGHVLPNVLPPILAYGMITIGIAMLIEAGLSFLGLGIRPPQPSWGNLIANGESSMLAAPQLVVEPALALLMTVVCLNILGDSLRRRLNQDR